MICFIVVIVYVQCSVATQLRHPSPSISYCAVWLFMLVRESVWLWGVYKGVTFRNKTLELIPTHVFLFVTSSSTSNFIDHTLPPPSSWPPRSFLWILLIKYGKFYFSKLRAVNNWLEKSRFAYAEIPVNRHFQFRHTRF